MPFDVAYFIKSPPVRLGQSILWTFVSYSLYLDGRVLITISNVGFFRVMFAAKL